MDKFLAGTFIYVLAVALSILVMIYGWGLKPVSWWWIILGGVFGRILVEIINSISKDK